MHQVDPGQRERHLRENSRIFDSYKLFISLNAGAIVLIATFLHDPPRITGARCLVTGALFFFLLSFGFSFYMLNATVRLASQIDDPTAYEKTIRDVSTPQVIARYSFVLGLASMTALALILLWR